MLRETLASLSSSSTNPPPPEDAWVNTHQRLLPKWQSLSLTHSHPSTIPISVSRVNQVDAARLDIELSAMLKEQLVKVFSLMKPGLLFQYEPELDAFLEFLIWRFSIWVDKPTPGNALMNLRYRDERAIETRGKVRTGLEGPGLTFAQKLWYCIATVGGQYIWARLQSFSSFRRWGDSEQRSLARRAWILIQHLEGFYKAASFSNLLIFLYTGRYRNLIERALQARLVYGSPNMNRAVSFEYMNRQLVWNEFSELLLLLLPLLNSSTIRNFLRPFSKDKSSSSGGDETVCPICQASPTIPFLALPCQHRINVGQPKHRDIMNLYFSICLDGLVLLLLPSYAMFCSSFIPKGNDMWPGLFFLLSLDMGGLASEEDHRFGGGSLSHFQSKNLENWEDQILNPSLRVPVVDVKQEVAQSSQLLSSSILDFSNNMMDGRNNLHQDHSSECNSTGTDGISKKARVQPSSTQTPLKVRKEKLCDRITALHQIVSPFGKTDTASVLLEAIGYIRFLQGQIEALSSPYLGNASGNMRHQHPVQGERNCIFPEDPGQVCFLGSITSLKATWGAFVFIKHLIKLLFYSKS
ncbi:hypothetical protein F0562_022925 [Nyssa sinensis]|uniref:RING-type E3 ubiquitin transferase (cysteine targeting) n=1 Tax=Nyssa sinensis TaxID=561372 RepID=A0A5J5BF55_9ASTE|nr:hypothetical protein F0562_022925 [Nyssa sinensis]